jgi:hypothetical protein
LISIPISLDDREFALVNGFKKTEDKAIQIVRSYLIKKYGDKIDIKPAPPGADLIVVYPNGEREFIEVKGTASNNISWGQLKVSSPQSYENLCNGVPLYRVIDVNTRTPQLFILRYGEHFVMEPEPRWAVKPSQLQRGTGMSQ